MTWRLAKSLDTLRRQVDEAAPKRSKTSDGAIGDQAHSARKSDHNPVGGVVHAIDITHDPASGVDGNVIAEALKASRDNRLRYIIWDRRIWSLDVSPEWRPYTGANPHNKHIHISVRSGSAGDDARPWKWGDAIPNKAAAPIPSHPVIYQGVIGAEDHVAKAKNALITALERERGFGPLLDGLARAFQKTSGLVADGKIGAYTWEKLIS
jgi:peptidoglycan hydrolase-like protein with peptidoglycan-binding domain